MRDQFCSFLLCVMQPLHLVCTPSVLPLLSLLLLLPAYIRLALLAQ